MLEEFSIFLLGRIDPGNIFHPSKDSESSDDLFVCGRWIDRRIETEENEWIMRHIL